MGLTTSGQVPLADVTANTALVDEDEIDFAALLS